MRSNATAWAGTVLFLAALSATGVAVIAFEVGDVGAAALLGVIAVACLGLAYGLDRRTQEVRVDV